MKPPHRPVPSLSGLAISQIKYSATDTNWEENIFIDPYKKDKQQRASSPSTPPPSPTPSQTQTQTKTQPNSLEIVETTYKLLEIKGLLGFVSPRNASMRRTRLPKVSEVTHHAIMTPTSITIKAKMAPFGEGQVSEFYRFPR